MKAYNYASFAKVFSEGLIDSNMTKVAQILFKPIISLGKCVNRFGNPYFIDNKDANDWYKQKRDIPANLKKAGESKAVWSGIGNYFDNKVFKKELSDLKTPDMLNNMVKLINESDLSAEYKNDLNKLYKAGDLGVFLGRAFILSILRDNKKKDVSDEKSEAVDYIKGAELKQEFEAFRAQVMEYKKLKPAPISPPVKIEEKEMKYVKELLRVYQEKTGKKCQRVEDLDACPTMKKNFNRQRKNYYLAETIRRGLRDTISPQDDGIFNSAKDEIYDGIIDMVEDDYNCGYNRMCAVLNHATLIQLSVCSNYLTLTWIENNEKKGICHMLVNDGKFNWMEGD